MAKNDVSEFPEIQDFDIVECVGKGAYGSSTLSVE